MAFNPIIGKDFTILIDGSIMFAAESFEVSFDKKEIDVTNLSSGGWDEYVVGTKGWSGSVDFLRCRTTDSSRGFDYLMDNYLGVTDTSLAVAFKTTITGNSVYTGSAWLTNIKTNNSGVNSKVTAAASFKGTGPVTKSIS